MKVGGVIAEFSPKSGPLVFPRGLDEEGKPVFLVFYAQAVRSMEEFDAVLPKPRAGGQYTRNGWEETDTDAPAYKVALAQWRAKRWAYIFIKTIEPSNMEWDTVDINKPDTWLGYESELRAVLGHFELNQLTQMVNAANALDEEALDEARANFFQTLARPVPTQVGIGPPSETVTS
jgi:hypothetical protein